LSEQRARAERVGRDVSAPVAVTHFFSSPGCHPAAVVRALRELAITDVVVDEEITGDGYWHVAAFTAILLTPRVVDQTENRMEQMARDAGARYDGWHITLTVGEEQRLRSGAA
jgi:hypothetical protein